MLSRYWILDCDWERVPAQRWRTRYCVGAVFLLHGELCDAGVTAV